MHKLIKEMSNEIEYTVREKGFGSVEKTIARFIPKIRSEMKVLQCSKAKVCGSSTLMCDHIKPHNEKCNCASVCGVAGGHCVDSFEAAQ
jgi:hypothetical protein